MVGVILLLMLVLKHHTHRIFQNYFSVTNKYKKIQQMNSTFKTEDI